MEIEEMLCSKLILLAKILQTRKKVGAMIALLNKLDAGIPCKSGTVPQR